MIEWRCLVLLPEGERDWRRVLAHDERQAAAMLLDEGLIPLDVRTGSKAISEILAQPVTLGGLGGGLGVSLSDQALILTQMAMLLRAGMPVDRSIDLLREQMARAAQRHYLAEVLTRVRSGETLAQALECRPVFPAYVTGVIAAAERSGHLDRAFDTLATRMNELASARRELMTALAYPVAVLAATMVALVIVVTAVIPQFEPLFEGEEQRLPTVTRFVLALSRILNSAFGWIALAVLIVGGLITLWLRSEHGRQAASRSRRFIPGMGVRDQYLAARFATILGTLLNNGMTIVRALPLVRRGLSSRRWQQYCTEVEIALREGQPIGRALRLGAMMPLTAIRLAEVGERSGRMGDALSEAGQIMHANAKARIDRFVALANPIAITTLGALVALLVGGVMLGIFALGDFAG